MESMVQYDLEICQQIRIKVSNRCGFIQIWIQANYLHTALQFFILVKQICYSRRMQCNQWDFVVVAWIHCGSQRVDTPVTALYITLSAQKDRGLWVFRVLA
jgi:hypothetical protein